jgi:hypothetical protein
VSPLPPMLDCDGDHAGRPHHEGCWVLVSGDPTIGVGEPIDPATAPALCVACYLDEHDRCRPPCDCTHDGPPAERDGRYGALWPAGDAGPRVEWDETGPAPRPAGTIACEWCSFWHQPGEECPDAPAAWEACTVCGREYVAGSVALCRTHLRCATCHPKPTIGMAPEYVRLHTSEPPEVPGVTRWFPFGETVEHVTAWDAPAGGNRIPAVQSGAGTITVDISGSPVADRLFRLLFDSFWLRKGRRMRRRRERQERTAERQMHQAYRQRQIARRRRRRRS